MWITLYKFILFIKYYILYLLYQLTYKHIYNYELRNN